MNLVILNVPSHYECESTNSYPYNIKRYLVKNIDRLSILTQLLQYRNFDHCRLNLYFFCPFCSCS